MLSRDKRLYLVLLLIGYFAIAYTAMNYLDITCVFLKIFGIPCPGCGMTRAFLSLLKLDFYSAAKYNILIFFMPYVFMYMFYDIKHKVHNKIMIGIALLAIINWVLKLITYF